MEVIKNTTLCKLHKVTKGFRPMGSDADLVFFVLKSLQGIVRQWSARQWSHVKIAILFLKPGMSCYNFNIEPVLFLVKHRHPPPRSRICAFLHMCEYMYQLILGDRGFSCAVSGLGQVFAARVFGLRPTKRSSPSHARKNLWYPGYMYLF